MNRHIAHRDEFSRLMEELDCRTAVEIGSAEGWFASKLLQCKTLTDLWLVDPWLDLNHRRACERMAATDSRVHLVQATGVEGAKVVPDVDFGYIDAMHDYASVSVDLHTWWPKTKKLLAGHDYTMSPLPKPYHNGVILAVEEFFIQEELYVTGAERPDYVSRLRSAQAADYLEDLGPWNSHNPSWYVFKEKQ